MVTGRPIIPNPPLRKSRKGTRGALSQSKLVTGDSLVYATAAQFQHYMHLPDPLPLYALLSAVAGNMLTGNPCWLMLVGASGAGKTALLRSLAKVPNLLYKSSINGEAALLSGVKKKDRASDSTGGILRQLQWGDLSPEAKGYGALVWSEFTSVLSLPREKLSTFLGILREIYDGSWIRDVGTEGARTLHWQGKIATFAGVTHVIDRHAEQMAQMGYRFVYLRLAATDGYAESRHAANVTDTDGNDSAMATLIGSMFDGLGLGFKEKQERRRLTPFELERIVGLAQFGARARSPVARETWGQTREVTEVVSVESSTRMTQELTQMYLGGEAIGLDEEDRWRVVGRVAFDSMPLTRGMVLGYVKRASGLGAGLGAGVGAGGNGTGVGVGANGKAVSAAAVAKAVACGDTTVRRELENLELLGVIEKSMSGWRLNRWARERLAAIEQGEG